MFWRLKTQIPSKQPWNGLLSSYFKVSQISYSILCFLSCIRITLSPSKNHTQAHSEWYQALGSLIKLSGRKEQTNTRVWVWNPSLVLLDVLNWPDLSHFTALEQPPCWQLTKLPPAPPPSCPKSPVSLTVLLWWPSVKSKKDPKKGSRAKKPPTSPGNLPYTNSCLYPISCLCAQPSQQSPPLLIPALHPLKPPVLFGFLFCWVFF